MPNPKASILIVDDRPEKLLALEAVLEDLNQTIVRAYSGREALRQVLSQDFAVILLDVNMPGMDGFETASMIRQRRSSRHTPIIFVTAFGDEMHAVRGYSLGAVDYILAPVVPDVLRTKVAVFVDLFNKTQQTRRQAESLRRRAAQLQKLAAASVAINSALSMERMLTTITDTARDVIGTHQAMILRAAEEGAPARPGRVRCLGGFSEKYAEWRDRELNLEPLAAALSVPGRSAARMAENDLRDHPDWPAIQNALIPPIVGGVLAAPLSGRDGASLGMIFVSDRLDGEPFSSDDEAILVQLAQMGSIAIENTVYAQEREANRIKDEFLATLGHELRTPLNAIVGWTQLLRMEPLEGEIAHGLEVIDRNARAQTKLIEDLLDVSRITSGKLRMRMIRSEFGPIVRAAADAARPAADAKRIAVHVRVPDDLPCVMLDPDRMQQVVWNLLTNAIRFTPADGTITVELDRDGERVRLRVTDTGSGIDPKFLPFVFDRFRQADSTSTRSHGGLGIGLTIVRHIVEQHGGSVSADSAGADRGSTFTVELPAAAPAPAALASEEDAPAGDGVGRCLPGVRVLLVDDDPDARDVLTATLRRAGADVISAASAAEAFDSLPAARPHVLVSDIAMPGQDGYTLLRRIRRLLAEEGGSVPAIALTAYAREEDRARALEAGFQDHIPKPVASAALLARISQLAGLNAAGAAVSGESA